MTIAIIDDDACTRSMLREIISASATVIVECDNGRSAVAVCRQRKVDVVLMDVRMPEMDGITATSCIKEQNPEIRVIMVSQHDDSYYRKAAKFAGAEAFFCKDNLLAVGDYLNK